MFRAIGAFTTAVLVASIFSGTGQAARQDLSKLTCGQGRSLVASSGAIVATTGPTTFDRIVHNRGFCQPGQDTIQQYLQTLDEPRCAVGYICRDRASNN